MANASTAGFGCRQTMTVGNTPATGGQSEFLVQGGAAPGATVAIFKGAPVAMQTAAGGAGALGFIQDQTAALMTDGIVGGNTWAHNTANTNKSLGVFNGATFVDATGKPSWTNGLIAGQTSSVDYNTASNNITAFVNTNPAQEYTVRADAALTNASFNTLTNTGFNLNDAGAGVSGMSDSTLDLSGVATTGVANYMWKIVRSANIENQKDFTVAGADVVISYNPQANQYQA
jgi:hypothetical protein